MAMKKQILFITSTRIGDAVLSTGILRHLSHAYPDCAVTIVCGPLCTSLFEAYPNLKEIIALKKEKRNGHWAKLWRRVFPTKWDMVIDLRNSAVSRLIFANKRFIAGTQIDKSRHKVVQAAQLMKGDLSNPSAPQLWFTPAQETAAKSLLGDDPRPVLAIGPTANWIGKIWPKANFVALINRLVFESDAPLNNYRVAIIAAPGEEEDAQFVLNSLPSDMRIDVIAKTTPGEAAAFLSHCAYYIGNDSGLMHCAAACGVKTLGLFGPSWPHLYSPWGEHSSYVSTAKDFAALTDFEGYDAKTLEHSLMFDLQCDEVYAAFKALLT
jgi:heptosyltransferase-3